MVAFRWDIPERFNIGADVADRYPSARALIEIEPSGGARECSFDAISALSNRLANVSVARGLQQGDRIATLLPQRHETAVTHVAAWKAGLISVPLFPLFGEQALEFRLQDSGARAIVTDRDQLPKLASLRERLPHLETVLCVDSPAEGALDLHALLTKASDRFEAKDTLADDPAFIIYTSGTTGQPKGALHAHRAALPPVRPGWTGTAIPGHRVAIVDEEGRELPPGEMGSLGYRRPDPVMFLGYWGNEAATQSKFRGDWLISGDLGVRDDQGYFRF